MQFFPIFDIQFQLCDYYVILIMKQLLNTPLIALIAEGVILIIPKVTVWTVFTICVW